MLSIITQITMKFGLSEFILVCFYSTFQWFVDIIWQHWLIFSHLLDSWNILYYMVLRLLPIFFRVLTFLYWCMYQKTVWLSIFYMCIPGGYAIGYVYGGVVSFHLVLIPLFYSSSKER